MLQRIDCKCSLDCSRGDFRDRRWRRRFALRGEVAEAEAERAGGQGAEGGVHPRGAVQAGAGLDRPLGVEQGGQLLRVEAGDVQADDADAIVAGARAIEPARRGGRSGRPAAAGRVRGFGPGSGARRADCDVADAGFQADDARHVEIARFVAVGERIGLNVFVAARAGAALAQRQQVLLDARRRGRAGRFPADRAAPCGPARPADGSRSGSTSIGT